VTPLPARSSRLKGVRSRAAALVTGTQDFGTFHHNEDDPAEANNVLVKDTTASYSDELLTAFKRKTQQLCDETREQYEQKIERQEVQHERQVQALQRQLREVVGSCVSLAEHEQILATTAKEQQRQLEEIRRLHRSQARELEQRCDEKWLATVADVKKQGEQDKAALMQRIEQLELQKSEATAEAKERELSELRWSEKLEAAVQAKKAVEQRVENVKKRLDEACRIIVALKTRLRHHARLARDLESQRDKTSETRDEVMQCKLAYAELKGDMDTRAAGLERELEHAQRALADERANVCTLQASTA
jgi:chromosome segregation ATPase